MKILITGASGFIGSHMLKYLKENGYSVIGCGRSLLEDKGIPYIKCDLTESIPDVEADVIIHAAGLNPSPTNAFYDYYTNNSKATETVLAYAKSHRVKKIIYIGTLASYGTVQGVLEEESPHNNPEGYGLTKYMAEQLIKNSGIPYHILLPATVLGKGCGENWVTRTAKLLSRNEDVTYYNGTGLFNNFVEIGDICAFILKLLEQRLNESETYLLGSCEMTTVESIVLSLKEQLLSSSRLFRGQEGKNQFYLNIDKAVGAGFSSAPISVMLAQVCAEVRNWG